MSATLPNPLPPDEDRGPQVLAFYWTLVAISTVVIGLRFYVRIKIHSLGWDDWMMLATWALFIVTTCNVTTLMSYGGGRHVWYLTPDQILKTRMWCIIPQLPNIICAATAKTSVTILILRFLGRVTYWRRALLIFLAVSVWILNLLTVIFLVAQCNPARALWDLSIDRSHCWDPRISNYFFNIDAAWNVFVDFVLAFLPATFIHSLHMRRKKKIALCTLLSLGILGSICGAVKIKYYYVDFTEANDFTWVGYDVEFWSAAESFLLIFCGCVPTLTPLWDRYVTHKLDSNYVRRPLINGGSACTASGPASFATAQSMRVDSSRGIANSTTSQMESQAELKMGAPVPETVRVTNTYTVEKD